MRWPWLLLGVCVREKVLHVVHVVSLIFPVNQNCVPLARSSHSMRVVQYWCMQRHQCLKRLNVHSSLCDNFFFTDMKLSHTWDTDLFVPGLCFCLCIESLCDLLSILKSLKIKSWISYTVIRAFMFTAHSTTKDIRAGRKRERQELHSLLPSAGSLLTHSCAES